MLTQPQPNIFGGLDGNVSIMGDEGSDYSVSAGQMEF